MQPVSPPMPAWYFVPTGKLLYPTGTNWCGERLMCALLKNKSESPSNPNNREQSVDPTKVDI
jgi:hypothetical protein